MLLLGFIPVGEDRGACVGFVLVDGEVAALVFELDVGDGVCLVELLPRFAFGGVALAHRPHAVGVRQAQR